MRCAALLLGVLLTITDNFCQVLAADRTEIVLSTSAPRFSSVLAGDLDGNPLNGMEAVLAGAEGDLSMVSLSNKSIVWNASIKRQSCIGSTNNRVLSSPALSKRGKENIIIVGTGGVGGKGCDGGVNAFNSVTGDLSWDFSTRKWSKKKKHWAFRYTVFSTPFSHDLDGDGDEDVSFGSFDRYFYSLSSSRGKPHWYYQAADTIWSSPAIVPSKGKKTDLVVATDISKNQNMRPPTPDGGYLYRMKHKKRNGSLYPFRDSKLSKWRSEFDQTLYASPAVGELIPENPGLEIAVGTGCFFPQNSDKKRGNWVKIISASNGKLLRTLFASSCSSASPALGDINGDLLLDVVSLTNGADGVTTVEAWDPRLEVKLWQAVPARGHKGWADHNSVILSDLDGNGSSEVVVATGSNMYILSGNDGEVLSKEKLPSSNLTTPVAIDIDGNLSPEIVIGSQKGSKGAVLVFSGFKEIGSVPGPNPEFYSPWPMFRQNPKRTGLVQ